jgi:hypothetical protein
LHKRLCIAIIILVNRKINKVVHGSGARRLVRKRDSRSVIRIFPATYLTQRRNSITSFAFAVAIRNVPLILVYVGETTTTLCL